ncbi:MAG: symmetrical bis(5'-nucleosyl)-tetraphosphatase [Gammaproteobacteria bacterium]|jgi:bis(5'-nucleosyl)-tetraphosphatase (symmetrical)
MATYAIGDVHGCVYELEALMKKISFNPSQDKLWFVGDLVGRGLFSLEVLRLVKNLDTSAIVILGNHDIYLLVLEYEKHLRPNHPKLEPIFTAKDSQELLNWLRHRPLLHCDDKLGYVMAHAGIYPKWTIEEAKIYAHEVEEALRGKEHPDFLHTVEGNKPNTWRKDLVGYDRLRFFVNCFTRMRFCSLDGKLNLTCKAEIGKQPAGYIPWFQIPGRLTKETKIIFGHWAALAGNTKEPFLYAIDTGCVWGGKLTAMCLENGELFSVPKNK